MNNIEKIKAEIERLKVDYLYRGYTFVPTAMQQLLNFIDSLPDENNPEPYNPVYDEDYLNEKIVKATKSWEGVDVNKMLADCRGYEEKPSEDLEKAAEEYAYRGIPDEIKQNVKPIADEIIKQFIAGAEWQKKQQ